MTTPERTVRRAAALPLAVAVCLAAGVGLASSAAAAPGFTFDQRVAGTDRVGTAVAAAERAFPGGGAGAIVLVNATRTVDGLTASYVAGLRNAPILYTDADTVPGATAGEMAKLGTKDVVLVGGEAVLTPRLVGALQSQGYHVERVGGADRYATAALAADSGTAKPGRVYLASGLRYADALVVGPLAYAKHYPILLTRPTDVPEPTSTELAKLDVDARTVVGGEAVVPPDTAAALSATARLSGADRQATAAAVATDAVAHEGFSPASIALTGGDDRNAVDALVAASVAGKNGVPLLFTKDNTVGSPTGSYLRAHSGELTGTGYVFGGTTAVPQSAADVATAAASNATSPNFPTAPGDAATLPVGAVRTYTVTGLDAATTYEIGLFPAGAHSVYTTGGMIFADADHDDFADGLGLTKAVLISVNGAPAAAGARTAAGVHPVNGAITFTVSTAAPDSVSPMLWQDTVANHKLDLLRPTTADTQAKGSAEAFALGGTATWQ